jgi:DNA adenine methylase
VGGSDDKAVAATIPIVEASAPLLLLDMGLSTVAIADRISGCEPVLRWAGSKRKLLPQLRAASAGVQFDRYVEPFAGSACLFFSVAPEKAVLSDINDELIHFYRVLKAHPKVLWRATIRHAVNPRTYYRLRSLNPRQLDDVDRAARFLYLNRFCFNGIYRENKRGIFNVPVGNKTGAVPGEAALVKASRLLRAARLVNSDFAESINYAGPRALYYLDPPYDYSGRLDRGEFGSKTFRAMDLPRLASLLDEVDRRGASFVLSYIDVFELLPIADRWNATRHRIRRQVASFSKFRRPMDELIITNF